ncbi:MAG: hypothetical protein ABI647_15700 [Gemmatimonadota bacterium]
MTGEPKGGDKKSAGSKLAFVVQKHAARNLHFDLRLEQVSEDASRRRFILSPAHCGGKRAQLLLNGRAQFPLAARLQRGEKVTLGEVFAFVSGLYFRGKLTYATRFSPEGESQVLVITTNRGLLPANTPVTLPDLVAFGSVDIEVDDERYRRPLERDLLLLAGADQLDVVLLGSVATNRYADILMAALRERLLFPVDFVGRGDMSRGALLLRATRDGVELPYRIVAGSVRRGARAPRINSP